MRFSLYLTVSLSVLALTACANKAELPPAISYDSESFKPATAQVDPEPEVADVGGTVPAPPPQLAPPPPAKPDTRPPTARVEAANKAALQEPTAHGYLNAVQVYQYTDGALYRLYAAPEQVSDIALQPGESLSAVSAGDTVRWVIGDTTSGNGDNKRVHILVKPFAPGLRTNLVITTDRRSYHLQLDSTDKTAMAVVSWTYPQDALASMKREIEGRQTVDAQVSLENIRFRYAISGDAPPWKPVRAFDDGSKVYIEFPARIDQGEAPPLFVVGPQGNSELVNYRVRGNYYVVDRLFAAAELRLGQKPQQVVRISRTDSVARADGEKAGG
ncbi:MAG: P-type conjugative transfer protein TrbG [Rhodospirillaceae bacterium]